MPYLLCLQCYYYIFKSAAFRSIMVLVPAADACSPVLFLRVRGVDELQSCPPSPDEIKLGSCLSFPPPSLHCMLSREMSWADLPRAVPALGPVPSVPISRALAGQES